MRRALSWTGLIAAGAACEARRGIRRKLSPDRNYNEVIADTQNSFNWSDKHTFRPHQHFTFDPCNWSRTLTEKGKQQHTLSIMQRLNTLAEREAEHISNERARQLPPEAQPSTNAAGGSGTSDDVPDYFFSASDTRDGGELSTSATGVSLQTLLDEAQALRRLLLMPRHEANASLHIRERQWSAYHAALLETYKRMASARAGETVSMDAIVYSWFVLLESIEPLLEARLCARDGCTSAEDCVRDVHATLKRTLLDAVTVSPEGVLALPRVGTELEEVAEVAYVLTHPFTRRGGVAEDDSVAPHSGKPLEINAALLTTIVDAVQRRLTEPVPVSSSASETSSSLYEKADPAHTAALLQAVQRMTAMIEVEDAGELEKVSQSAQRLSTLVRDSGLCTLEILRGSTDVGVREGVRRSLGWKVGVPRSSRDEAAPQSGVAEPWAHRAVEVDITSGPRGVQRPHTEPDDVYYVVCAAIGLLSLPFAKSETAQRAVTEAVDAVLVLLSHTPNYDLPREEMARMARQVLQHPQACGHRVSTSSAADRSLRVMLLLSRLPIQLVEDRGCLCDLLFSLCMDAEEPTFDGSLRTRAEWRRLRGVIMQRLLTTLTAKELTAHHSTTPWEEVAAFGHYDAQVPLELWRDTCRERFCASAAVECALWTGTCSPATAEALIVLRARDCSDKKRGSAQMSWMCVASLAHCVCAISGGTVPVDKCLGDPTAWDEALMYVSSADNTGGIAQLFAAAQKHVRDFAVVSAKACAI